MSVSIAFPLNTLWALLQYLIKPVSFVRKHSDKLSQLLWATFLENCFSTLRWTTLQVNMDVDKKWDLRKTYTCLLINHTYYEYSGEIRQKEGPRKYGKKLSF